MLFPPTCRYPTNPVLRAITPKDTVRNLDVYPVKLTQVTSRAPLLRKQSAIQSPAVDGSCVVREYHQQLLNFLSA